MADMTCPRCASEDYSQLKRTEGGEMTDNKPDIVSTLQAEGSELKQRGRYFWAVCPFHSEKTPSFKVDPERQTFHCFGCGEHGDVLDFVMRYRGLSFRDTLAYLGMKTGELTAADRQHIEREKKKRAALAAFRQWCNREFNELADLYRKLQQAKMRCRTWEDVERIAPFYHAESDWQYRMEILKGKDDRTKLDLYREELRNAA